MATFARACKPWFVYRPAQLLHRLVPRVPSSGFTAVPAAWGATIFVDTSRDIGRSLLTTGVFDLAVSEAIARLVPPGGTMVDAGANVGYMSVLAAHVAGPGGTILAFEPNPELLGILHRNVERAAGTRGPLPSSGQAAPITVYPVALGATPGNATLLLPAEFATNDGVARVIPTTEGAAGPGTVGAAGRTLTVPVTTLDLAIGDRRVDLLKLDVEGFEAEVLAGAYNALSAHRIRHVIFEEHDIRRSEAAVRLRAAGYSLFALGWRLRRLRIEPLVDQPIARAYEAPNFIATIDPAHLQSACTPPGWRTLRPL